MSEFEEALLSRPDHVFISIIACTDDLNSIGYLNYLDINMPRLDICDDYENELVEVRSIQGENCVFTFGDYVTKCILGPIFQNLDKLDEYKISSDNFNQTVKNLKIVNPNTKSNNNDRSNLAKFNIKDTSKLKTRKSSSTDTLKISQTPTKAVYHQDAENKTLSISNSSAVEHVISINISLFQKIRFYFLIT